jgi:hypothetical protein
MEKAHNPLPLYDSRRTIARAFGPLRDLTESDAMLHCGSMDGDNELSHRALRPELCNGERNGFTKRFCLYINVKQDSVGVGKRDPAAVQGSIIARCSSFVRLRAIYSGRILYSMKLNDRVLDGLAGMSAEIRTSFLIAQVHT